MLTLSMERNIALFFQSWNLILSNSLFKFWDYFIIQQDSDVTPRLRSRTMFRLSGAFQHPLTGTTVCFFILAPYSLPTLFFHICLCFQEIDFFFFKKGPELMEMEGGKNGRLFFFNPSNFVFEEYIPQICRGLTSLCNKAAHFYPSRIKVCKRVFYKNV